MSKDKSTAILLTIILALGLFMRLVSINGVSYSNDELSALNRTQYADVGTMIQKGVIDIDYHPIATQLFMYGWVNAFGMEEWVVRIPFVLFSMLSIWLTFKIGKLWGGEKTGLIAASLLACLAFPVLYSRLARPYAMGLVFLLASVYYWSRLVKHNDLKLRSNILGFVLFGALTTWTHYYASVTLALVGLLGCFFVRKETVKYYVISGVALLLLSALHWPITKAQLAKGGVGGADGWLDPPGADWLYEFFLQAFNGHFLLWTLSALVMLGIFFIGSKKRAWRPFTFFALVFIISYLFGDQYSKQVNPILQHSGLLFSYPLLLIAMSYAMAQLPIPSKSILPIILLGLGTYTSFNMPEADPFGLKQFGRFKELANSFDKWEQEHPGAISFAANVNDPFYLEHYFKRDKTLLVDNVKEREDMFRFREALETSTSDYFAFCWSTIQMPEEAYPLIRQYFPYTIAKDVYFNSEALLFSRIEPNDYTAIQKSYFGETWNLPKGKNNDFLLEEEYSPNTIITAEALRSKSQQELTYVFFEVELRAPPESNPVLVMDWKRKEKTIHWSGSELNEFYPSGEWRKLIHVQAIPNEIWMDDELKMFVWNRGPGRLEIRSVRTWVQSEL